MVAKFPRFHRRRFRGLTVVGPLHVPTLRVETIIPPSRGTVATLRVSATHSLISLTSLVRLRPAVEAASTKLVKPLFCKFRTVVPTWLTRLKQVSVVLRSPLRSLPAITRLAMTRRCIVILFSCVFRRRRSYLIALNLIKIVG